ncbi:tyrosine-type recombinase/integrase [Vibrio parahaemolyticus]|nr:tyrosine-type recombinase/integrase [Vibrio parahaemolyticus]ELA7517723.1 tyrosine-type recombinase/integrase [Vibrio parahaemolyticus]ELC0679378.1 tyrosine-type recombinase/integrase [Vibrio parahaemolyticus]
MNARKRTTGRERIPKHLYVEKRKGQTRYRFTLIDGTKMLMPAEFSLDDIIAAANAYNDEHRPAQHFQISPKSRKDKFNRPMNEWLEHEMVRIKNEEELSAEILRQVSSDIARLNEFLGDKFSKSINLETMNDFLNTYYGDKSKEVYNKKLSRLKKIFSYLADESAIGENFMLNKKPKRLNASDNKKERLDLDIEAFKAIEKEAPLFLKVAMGLSIQSTHAVAELHRIKYRIPKPKPDTCGIVWFDTPKPENGEMVFGTLYIHRAKVKNAKTSYVAIPVTSAIKEVVELSKTDKLHCPYVVHRRPARNNNIAKQCDHRYQVTSRMISETFSKVRDELGLYSNVEKAKRPTFHEIRRLSAKLIDEMGVNPRQRMAHASDRTTQIYTDSHDVEWHEVPAISVAI